MSGRRPRGAAHASCVALLFAFTGCGPAVAAEEVRVLAAASLSDALQEVARTYERSTRDRIVLNLGASSTLARQIEQGAPADLFLSADEAKVDMLAKRGLIAQRVSILSNSLVIVVPSDRPNRGLLQAKSIALAEPNSVPAGIYAKQYLVAAGLWDRVAAKIIPTENVRAALAAVEAGNADAAIVYKTDVRIAKRVRVAEAVRNGPPISYPFALLRDAESPEAARRFFAYLQSPEARAIFVKHGFVVLRDRSDRSNRSDRTNRPAVPATYATYVTYVTYPPYSP